MQREISRSTRQTTAALHGDPVPEPVRPQAHTKEQLVDISRVALHAQLAVLSTWNQSVDALFNPVIRELHRRGW